MRSKTVGDEMVGDVLASVMEEATRTAREKFQVVGRTNDYYITLEQLSEIINVGDVEVVANGPDDFDSIGGAN